MKTIVIGGTGMLGQDLVAALQTRGHEVWAPSRAEFDLTDPVACAQLVDPSVAGEVVFNCAAYTAVDLAESEEQIAHEVNALGVSYLAQACAAGNRRLVHISTDFVFDGNATNPYLPTAPTNPLGAYGRTKLAGEHAVIALGFAVVRTSWLFGPLGKSFPRTIIRAWRAGRELRVVSDQVGCPTYTGHLAEVLAERMFPGPGVVHAPGPEAMSWHEFARKALHAYATAWGLSDPVEITAIRSEDWPTPAKRPPYSVLGEPLAQMPPLEDALLDFARRLGPEP